MVRKCKICEVEKDLSEFSIHTRKEGKIYYRSECKNCFDAKYRDRYREKDKIRARNYYKYNKDIIKKKAREKYQENHEAEIQRNREYRKNNRKKLNAQRREYYKKNREMEIRKQIEYAKVKYHNDPEFKLRQNISNVVRGQLKKRGSSKRGCSALKALGFTIEELKMHLESQFEPWMSWDNWGVYDSGSWDDNNSSTWTWQIDHIVPQAKFKFLSMDAPQFKECWSLKNLRPLGAKDNLLKGNR